MDGYIYTFNKHIQHVNLSSQFARGGLEMTILNFYNSLSLSLSMWVSIFSFLY